MDLAKIASTHTASLWAHLLCLIIRDFYRLSVCFASCIALIIATLTSVQQMQRKKENPRPSINIQSRFVNEGLKAD